MSAKSSDFRRTNQIERNVCIPHIENHLLNKTYPMRLSLRNKFRHKSINFGIANLHKRKYLCHLDIKAKMD